MVNLNHNQDDNRINGEGKPVPLLIDVQEVARLLGISVRSIHRGVASGEIIPPVHLRGSTRWQLAELEAWVAQGCPIPPGGNNIRRR